MARTVRMSRGQLRQIIREEASRLAEVRRLPKAPAAGRSFGDWMNELEKILDETGYGSISDTLAFEHLSSENQAAVDAANEILQKLYEEDMSEQDAVEELDRGEEFWTAHGYDVDALAADSNFYGTADFDERVGGNAEEDAECEDCLGSGDCSECSEDGTDTNTGKTCDNCGGTHECPTCQGSGNADPYADD